jgi:uncharacterized SAM-binding protein YcdF (DUF218 family)
MFTLKKLLTPFLLPPGLFITLWIATGLVLFWRRRTGMALLQWAMAALLWSVSIQPVANYLLAGLEGSYDFSNQPRGSDVIVLLGGSVITDVPDLTGRGAPVDDMLSRIVTTARLWRQLHLPVIITSGSPVAGKPPGAPIIKRFLVDLGVDEADIILEVKSRDTYENALFTRTICKANGFKRLILITSASHLDRSVLAFRALGMTVTPVPALRRTVPGRKYSWCDCLPNVAALSITAQALHEYLGQIYYQWQLKWAER